MSDLSADDKRRAALWAAGWLGGQPVLYQEAANALRVYADPPDTVESLREQLAAERDHRRIAVVAGNQSNAELARLRVTHADTRTDLHKAKAEIYRLRAAVPVAEAAWTRGRTLPSGTQGLLPVRLSDEGDEWDYIPIDEGPSYLCGVDSETGKAVFIDHWALRGGPAPGGEHWLGGDHSNQTSWEQDGTTPGQTAYEAYPGPDARGWDQTSWMTRDPYDRIAAAVLAAHGTPTLTPVGEHPEPGTRGLLPVVVNEGDEWVFYCGPDTIYVCEAGSDTGSIVLADPRPDGA